MDEARVSGKKLAVCSAATKSSVILCLESLIGMVTAAAVAVAVALLAILMLVVRPIVATMVASAALAAFLVVHKTGWWAGYTDDVEPHYAGARIEGDVITLYFVKQMMDDFKNQKSLHKRVWNQRDNGFSWDNGLPVVSSVWQGDTQ